MTRRRQHIRAALFLLFGAISLSGCGPAGGPVTRDGDVIVPAASHGDPSSAPVQPIFYKHSVHAGQNEMPCLYCHTYAEKSTVANLPAVQVCMNCHKYVLGSNPEYQAEIAKLTDFYNKNKPIPWVRVHHLPEHAFFNHKRHVKAGMQCQTCHGPVQTMDRVYQYSSLKMGWCVTCHKANLQNKKAPASIDCYTCHR